MLYHNFLCIAKTRFFFQIQVRSVWEDYLARLDLQVCLGNVECKACKENKEKWACKVNKKNLDKIVFEKTSGPWPLYTNK